MAQPAGDSTSKRLEQKVRAFVQQHGLWAGDGETLLAVSGGQDSTALALFLSSLDRKRSRSLSVAYFDHGLRGAGPAQAEVDFLTRLCGKLGLPLRTGKGDVRGLARAERRSIEEAARILRYEFLHQAAAERGAVQVATGHTASDQAETVLLNLIRGTGLKGLAGMRPRSGWPFNATGGLTLVRPLLALSRAETLAYCLARGVEPLTDPSNLSPEFRRNRVRHEVLPLLKTLNTGVEGAVLRLSESAREDAELLDAVAAESVKKIAAGAAIDRQWLQAQAPALARRAIRGALGEAGGDLKEITARHLAALERLARSGATGDRCDLPRGLLADLTPDSLRIRRAEVLPPPPAEVDLPVLGQAKFGDLIVAASLEAPAAAKSVAVDREVLAGGVTVRGRRRGDRFQPLGMTGTRKLQDFFVDLKLPREERDRVPLFVTKRGIAWIGGMRLADWAQPKPSAAVVVLSFRPGPLL